MILWATIEIKAVLQIVKITSLYKLLLNNKELYIMDTTYFDDMQC